MRGTEHDYHEFYLSLGYSDMEPDEPSGSMSCAAVKTTAMPEVSGP